MSWLNYHHFLYFWTVAREGSVARAAEKLRVSPPTISEQLRAFEASLGEQLFRRAGRGLELTEVGRIALEYGDEIFHLGREFQAVVQGGHARPGPRLVVGVADSVPKAVAHRLLAPALEGKSPVRLVCREGGVERLLTELSLHNLEMILTDSPVSPTLKQVAHSHPLGESDITVVGAPELAQKLRAGFPKSLDGAPVLLPCEDVDLRRALDRWFENVSVRPKVVAEFEDSALLKTFGSSGHGVFAVPTLVARDVSRQFRVRVVGRIREVRERFYAVTVERKVKHPAVLALCQAARQRLTRAAE